MLIIFLLGSMVLFINGLAAQGLARENVSFLNNQNAQTYIIEK